LNNIVTLKSGLAVTQRHWNWYHSKAWVWFSIRLPELLWFNLVSFWDIARYWSTIEIFSYPLHSMPH